MKQLLSLLLALLIAAGMLTGCESNENKMEVLMGKWQMAYTADANLAKTCLENLDLAEEEIALVDLNTLKMCVFVEYSAGTYRIALEPDIIKDNVEEYLTDVFDNLYENRQELNGFYGEDFSEMTKGEFRQFYAELYTFANFTDLMDAFVEGCFDYEVLGENAETGTYHIKGDKIYRTIDGTSEEEYMTYRINGNTLTLIYADFEEVFTRAE